MNTLFPVGTVIPVLTDPLPFGALKLDGSWVSSELYSALLDFAWANNLVKTEAEYNTALLESGQVPYFCVNADSSRFRVPTMNGAVGTLCVQALHGVRGDAASLDTPTAPSIESIDANSCISSTPFGWYNEIDGLVDVYGQVSLVSGESSIVPAVRMRSILNVEVSAGNVKEVSPDAIKIQVEEDTDVTYHIIGKV